MWTSDELNRIGSADELEIQSMRKDGTLRSPVTIWVARAGDQLFVRAIRGRSGWFRGTLSRHAGRIRAGGVVKDVTFVEETDPAIQAQIDAAYRQKYQRYPKEYVDACLNAEARAATIRLEPVTSNG